MKFRTATKDLTCDWCSFDIEEDDKYGISDVNEILCLDCGESETEYKNAEN